jgi:hypothetical protein
VAYAIDPDHDTVLYREAYALAACLLLSEFERAVPPSPLCAACRGGMG